MRITVAQLNPVVGAIDDNVDRILNVVRESSRESADLVVFSELIITGYPPRDLLERPAFIEKVRAAVGRVAVASKKYPDLGIILGCPLPTGEAVGKALYNSALLISDGKIEFEQPKMLLPMYDVFDEARYFKAGTDNATFAFKDVKLGLSICEDLWFEPDPWNQRLYSIDPIDMLAKKGASFIVNISASPFSVGKEKARYDLIRNHCGKHSTPFLFVNQVGGNDELVFDGRSLYVDRTGKALHIFPSFEESVKTIDTEDVGTADDYVFEEEIETVFKALVLGTRDYLTKCGISKAIVGMSGGIDSAVTAAIARAAIGPENLVLLSMPSPYTSRSSVEDAREMAERMGVEFLVIEIASAMKAYENALENVFAGTEKDVTEENIQARIRGNLLMAYSNKFGHLPLSTGNKSELAVGYCTLYGDMSGGLAVISDVPKTMVYRLADHINEMSSWIPKNIIRRAPSAELKPDQKDQDTLPPYDILDQVLERYIDRHRSYEQIVEEGFDRDTVSWIVDTVRKNEYKRKQAAPGLKVTSKAFGSGRRMPIAARYDV